MSVSTCTTFPRAPSFIYFSLRNRTHSAGMNLCLYLLIILGVMGFLPLFHGLQGQEAHPWQHSRTSEASTSSGHRPCSSYLPFSCLFFPPSLLPSPLFSLSFYWPLISSPSASASKGLGLQARTTVPGSPMENLKCQQDGLVWVKVLAAKL